MNRKVGSVVFLLVICFLLIVTNGCDDESEPKSTTCKPSGKLSGKNPPGGCHTDDCCKAGKFYDIYKCSPPVTHHTKATLTENDFSEGGSGGAQAECDNKYHSNSELIVALSTGWYNKGKRCHKFIKIHGNGKTVKAKVVDECDSTVGCDKDHAHEPPCDNNIVDASAAVWNALGVPKNSDKRGWMDIYWSDA